MILSFSNTKKTKMEELLNQYCTVRDDLKKVDRAVDNALGTVHHYQKTLKDLQLQMEHCQEYLKQAQELQNSLELKQAAFEIDLARLGVLIKSFSSI